MTTYKQALRNTSYWRWKRFRIQVVRFVKLTPFWKLAEKVVHDWPADLTTGAEEGQL